MQDLANTAWGFAKACQPEAQLFTALAMAAEQRMGEFNVKMLAEKVSIVWAFATVG